MEHPLRINFIQAAYKWFSSNIYPSIFEIVFKLLSPLVTDFEIETLSLYFH